MQTIPLEICIECTTPTATRGAVAAAYAGGASRVELCAAMSLDGLTPTPEALLVARKAFRDRPGMMVMIRPRGGDFCYSTEELERMFLQT